MKKKTKKITKKATKKKVVKKKAAKKKVVKKKVRFNLVVSYDLDAHEWGSLDRKIESTVGNKYASGAGTGFGMRDISFWFPTKLSMESGIKRLKKLNLKDVDWEYSEEEQD